MEKQKGQFSKRLIYLWELEQFRLLDNYEWYFNSLKKLELWNLKEFLYLLSGKVIAGRHS